MDFIKQLVAFDKKSSGNLTPVAIAIYLKLFMINNERGREEWFEESDFWLGRAVGIKRRETIVSALNVLRQKGFIEFERGSGTNRPTRYHITDLSTNCSQNNPQELINSSSDSGRYSSSNSGSTSGRYSGSDSPSNSPRYVSPLINSKKKSKSKGEGIIRACATPKFHPPTLDDVNQYVLEKNLHVSAKKFWEYYDAGGWIDAKGNPVKNWKQKLLTWEAHEPKPTSSTQNDIDRAIEFFERQEEGII